MSRRKEYETGANFYGSVTRHITISNVDIVFLISIRIQVTLTLYKELSQFPEYKVLNNFKKIIILNFLFIPAIECKTCNSNFSFI